MIWRSWHPSGRAGSTRPRSRCQSHVPAIIIAGSPHYDRDAMITYFLLDFILFRRIPSIWHHPRYCFLLRSFLALHFAKHRRPSYLLASFGTLDAAGCPLADPQPYYAQIISQHSHTFAAVKPLNFSWRARPYYHIMIFASSPSLAIWPILKYCPPLMSKPPRYFYQGSQA